MERVFGSMALVSKSLGPAYTWMIVQYLYNATNMETWIWTIQQIWSNTLSEVASCSFYTKLG